MIVMFKAQEEFRDYKDSKRQAVVENHYREMRRHQTVEFVDRMYRKYHSFDRKQMTIWEAFDVLGSFVDASDPDSELPNIEHAFQTAEAIRKDGHPDWLQLVGLIHDLGKMMFLWGREEDGQVGTATGPQWALGGDTWVVGCRIPECVVFSEFNELNPDMHDARYNTELGIYASSVTGVPPEEREGFASLRFAYGHDEYLYRLLVHNGTSIPPEGLAMIRLHSCYPWHTGGAYQKLMNKEDEKMIAWVRFFNQYDLYTKADTRPDIASLKPYYSTIIAKYLPGKDGRLWW